MATPDATSDMAQFFDFGEAAMPQPSPMEGHNVADPVVSEQLPLPNAPGQATSTEPDIDWCSMLPGYQKPAHPCNYCRSKSLECFIFNSDGSGKSKCSPCSVLSRPCSFSNSEGMSAQRRRTALNTLDVADEKDPRFRGGLTGRKKMRSLGHVGPIEYDEQHESVSKKGAAAARFAPSTREVLRDWITAHIDHPYLTDEDKDKLKLQTGLSIGQISTWMANARRKQKSRLKRNASPSIRPSAGAIDIPHGRTWESLNPLERWKHSPPENEPAPMVAIAHAVETFDPPTSARPSSAQGRANTSNGSTGSQSFPKVPSISSLETGWTNQSSASLGSHNSAYSHGSRHSLGSLNSLKSKQRRRQRRICARTPKPSVEESARKYQCTFCTDRFKSKYDWSRHEKSLHLSLEKWLCAPLGEIITDTLTGQRKCVYCDMLDPSAEHLATHNHATCHDKGIEARTFYRKDHLRQHLRLIHGCKLTPSMETWKSVAQNIKAQCGFCNAKFNEWQARVDHLAKEFRNGADMKDWKGCRGLDPHVAIHVINAMPPYLIANESKSPFPFSATNTASIKQVSLRVQNQDIQYALSDDHQSHGSPPLENRNSVSSSSAAPQSNKDSSHTHPNATCWEFITVELGRFARRYIKKHGPELLTDDLLQAEAREILYGDRDDMWNQTSADNPEWLDLFRKAHGIHNDAAIDSYGRLHVYDDLGAPKPLLDPLREANNFNVLDMDLNDPDRDASFEASLSGLLRTMPSQLSSGQRSPFSAPGLTTSSCALPTLPIGFATTASQSLNGIYDSIFETKCPLANSHSQDNLFDPIVEIDCSSAHSSRPAFEGPSAGLRSFSPDTSQSCAFTSEQISATLLTGPLPAGIQIPSWDGLPAELQDPTISAGPASNIAVPMTATTGLHFPPLEFATPGIEDVRWDDAEMNFQIDMDVDLDLQFDMNLDVLDTC